MNEYRKISSLVLSDAPARAALLSGVNQMADVVASSLGPLGQNTALAKAVATGEVYERIVLHDGVSIAKSIDLPNEFENMGAQLLLQASQKQVDAVGDGTTVVMIIAQAIIQECFKLVAAGVNPMSLRKGLEDSVSMLTKELENMAIPVKTLKDLISIATISAENEELGELVAKTLDKIGKEGIVTVEESKSPETTVEHQEGMQIDKGYLHPYFVTNPERMEAVIENAYFLITDKPVTTLINFEEFFKSFTPQSKNLVIISPDISGEALPILAGHKIQGRLQVICIQAPSMGSNQKGILQDLAILTGGKFISEDANFKFEDLTIDDLGFAENITSTKSESIIVGGSGTKEEVDQRVASLRKQLEDSDLSEFDRSQMEARIGKLTNGVAVIRVGGQTEVEMKERRERVLDAVAATRAAMDKGIVAGGEIVYLSLSDKLTKSDYAATILREALKKPFKKLISNAGFDSGEKIAQLQAPNYISVGKERGDNIFKLEESSNIGFDVTDGQFKDMIKASIIDPVLVPINALRNAVSVAVQIITTQNIIIPSKEVKNENG